MSLFAVGGSDWVEFALPLMQLFTVSMQMTVVDQQLFNWIALPGVAVMQEEMLKRARTSGKHIAETLMKPMSEAKYIGEAGMCPVCHSKLLEMTNSLTQVSCAVRGIKGALKIDGEQVTFEVSEQEKMKSHMLLSGKFMHAEDLKNRSLKPLPNMHEIPGKLEKYKSYLTYSKPEI